MIRIVRNNFQDAQVEDHVLDSMIDSQKIIAFSRASTWVVVGKDSVRRHHTFYSGEERRKIVYGRDFCMK